MSESIYGRADVAQLLRVTPAAISNYRARYENVPAPQYVTTDGRPFWSVDGMKAWRQWQDARRLPAKSDRRREAHDAVEKLRNQLS